MDPASAPAHEREHRHGELPGCDGVDVEHLPQRAGLQGLELSEPHDAHAVDQHVQPAALRLHRLRQPRDVLHIGGVGRHPDDPLTGRGDEGAGLPELLLPASADEQVCPFLMEPLRNRASDSAPSPGNERRIPFKHAHGLSFRRIAAAIARRMVAHPLGILHREGSTCYYAPSDVPPTIRILGQCRDKLSEGARRSAGRCGVAPAAIRKPGQGRSRRGSFGRQARA